MNIEVDGLVKHTSEFEGCKFTPKGMMQIQVNQDVSFEALRTAFLDTYM